MRIAHEAIAPSVELSSRYITARFLLDKAGDLVDESGSTLKISLENMPPALEESRRKITRLEIEREAIRADGKREAAKGRLTAVEPERNQR